MTIGKLSLNRCTALALMALHCCAFAQYTPYLSMTGITWEDETTFWLDGARIVGLGLSANDEVNAKFAFRTSDASFVLVDSKIIQGAGVVYRDLAFTSIDVLPRTIAYQVAGRSYAGDTTDHGFTATASAPFVASAILQPGHVISFKLSSPSSDFRYELSDATGKILSSFDGLAAASIISGAYRVTTPGTYYLKIVPRNTSGGMSFNLALFNGNNRTLQTLYDGSSVNVAFATNLRDYFKGVVQLNAGQRLSLPTPSDSNISICLLDSFSRQKSCPHGLALSYKATVSGSYYLFIYNERGWGSSYYGTLAVTQEALASSVDSQGRALARESTKVNSVSPVDPAR